MWQWQRPNWNSVETSHKCSTFSVPSEDTGEGQGMNDCLGGNNTGSDCSAPTALGALPCCITPRGAKLQLKNVEGSSPHTGTSVLYSVSISFTHVTLQKFLWFLRLSNLFLQSAVSNFKNLGILSLTKESFFSLSSLSYHLRENNW